MFESDLSDDAFRAEIRRWLAANFPASMAFVNPVPMLNDPDVAAAEPAFAPWHKAVAEAGLAVPTWPRIYGGAGLLEVQARILGEEMVRIGAFNPLRSNGTMMLGPTLLEYGTDEQKARHLPRIARGESRWCQGFSEPGAGSDLASLQTRCIDMGDHWLVSGQKIWTSGANHSDWCFALVRTDKTRKQGGISFLLIDMASPGIEVRTITLISGSTHFCEVFLTDVKVPKDNLVGTVNQGWGIAKRLMQHERDSLSEGRGEGASLADLAREHVGVDMEGRIADPDLRARLIRHAMRAKAYGLTLRRKALEASAGAGPSADVSALKNLGSDVAQMRAELMIEILGSQGTGWQGPGYDEAAIDATRGWLHSKAFSIYGGSREVQNNITAKRVLGLPDPQPVQKG